MKVFLSCILVVFVVCVAGREGPEAKDKKWEQCNDQQDSGLSQLSNQFAKKKYYVMDASEPCLKCNVSNLESIKRLDDSKFDKKNEQTTEHKMKIGFDSLTIVCDCEMANPSGDPIKGKTETLWVEPEVGLEMILNSDKNTCQIPKSDVLSPVNQKTAKLDCKGSDKYIEKCEDARDKGTFDKITKDSVQVLFPGESTKMIQSDNNLLMELNCENC